jgi:hypothetical protein
VNNLRFVRTINLSVDIKTTAIELISLLKKASSFQQQWHQPAILKQMIQRYYRFMQLKSSQPSNAFLISTLDIEIIWQTHLLRPEMYQKDCLRLFHRVIDHSLIINEVEQHYIEQAFIDTCQLYEERFGEKYCQLRSDCPTRRYGSYFNPRTSYSYWDETHFDFSSNPPDNYENPFSFTEHDIISDGKWYELYQQFMSTSSKKVRIQGNHYYDAPEMNLRFWTVEPLEKSYERFLYMAAKYPLINGILQPTYAVII